MSDMLTKTRVTSHRVTPPTEKIGHESNSKPARVAPMNPPADLRIPTSVPVPVGKWVAGVSRKQSVQKSRTPHPECSVCYTVLLLVAAGCSSK